MHHIHMSTPFFFVTVFGFIGLVAIIFAFVRSMKNDRLEAERAIEALKAEQAYRAANPVRPTAFEIQQVHGERLEARQAVNGTPFASYETYAPRPAATMTQPMPAYAPAAPVYSHDPMLGLATGMLVGSALSHSSHGHGGNTTIINEAPSSHAHSYSDSSSSSSYSSSSSSDSGFSYSDSSSSSSYSDSGSSSGFDASW